MHAARLCFCLVVLTLAGCAQLWGYDTEDFVVFSSEGYDIYPWNGNPGQSLEELPDDATLQGCIGHCDSLSNCVGFSRSKEVGDSEPGICWYKYDMPEAARTYYDDDYHTFLRQ